MMSWITLVDLVRIYQFVTEEEGLDGVLNAVSPAAVSNLDFTKALGSALRRPTVLPMPSWLVRALFGTMADETLLANLTVQPKRLEAAGFQWRSSTIENAFAAIFKST
jgi:NAD dependent epimerase/dehydratase family enzyme